ncbi:UDP-N-acetylmuramoyl-tripeptide--D-alanyl-D-alanine ligase [uncultured Algimonas sp.]|uniref:UDP-N-acetylmuramoyl-tripeptide--D-alanyl-D- alanine ligase n=1 Tax=uncultured Algimonas sp. TaxID=1547920 RepID=UPI00260E20C1|nr:UDP-N-acetylmuramoyl-tripeptide--D-alanyl-D-alanine ligase [uncultured Algimonas sp.]
MSSLWTSADIAAATDGHENGTFEATGLSIDSRTTRPGDLFVPLIDARDGHDFIDAALMAGAAGTLADRNGFAPSVIVDDTMVALRALGLAGRQRSQARRIAVTGSVGKTSVKDALGIMLSAFGPTHISARSFNNHLGVPITLATLSPEADFAVFETGMNHAGELTDLSEQVAPHIALITTVAGAHRANFDSVADIADAKAEIRHGLVEDGLLILNADNEYTPRIRRLAENLGIVTFGRSDDADIRILSSDHGADGGTVRLDVAGDSVSVELNVAGEHWDHNAAACIAIAHALGLDVQRAADALSGVKASHGRGDIHTVIIDGKSVTLIDESYNANPTSMRAAIAAAALQPGRKIAVLGDMHELGADELELHAVLADPLQKAGFARVLTIGECMRSLRGALPRDLRALQADTIELIDDALRDELRDGDVLLIKGSNATGLGRLAGRLKRGGPD